jgi:hypothetical protein
MAGDVDHPVVIGGFLKSGLSIAIAEQDAEKNRNIKLR